MDHLRQPKERDGTLPPIEIPYFSKEPYDGSAFLDYPTRKLCVDRERLRLPLIPAEQLPDATKFFQRWLYFGLLSEFFGSKLNLEDFKEKNALGGSVVVTKRLKSYLEDWYVQMSEKGVEDRRNVLRHLYICLHEAQGFDNSLAVWENELDDRYASVPLHVSTSFLLVSLSITVLLDTLYVACSSIKESVSDAGNMHMEYMNARTGKFLEKRLVELGWCQYEVSQFHNQMPASTLYYLASLKRARTYTNHSKCSKVECVANNIDEEHYQTCHVQHGCICPHKSPSFESLQRIVDNHGIAIIKCTLNVFNSGSEDTYAFDFVEWNPTTPYIAISHVWSDGLGNPRSNYLPLCQLSRLYWLIRSLQMQSTLSPSSEAVYFWMDTLCCPPTPQHKSLKNAVVSQMRDIYAKADKVLVLDAEVQKFQTGNCFEETFARILCSNWMKRAWTLQEAIFAKRLFVPFQDGIIDMQGSWDGHFLDRNVLNKWPTDEGPGLELDRLCFLMGRFYFNFKTIQKSDGEERFARAWNELGMRATSKPKDILVIFVTILKTFGWSKSTFLEFLEMSANEKMKKLLKSQKRLPIKILADPGPKLQDAYFSWAPSSISRTPINWGTGEAVMDDSGHGLLVTCPGILLTCMVIEDLIYWKDEWSGHWYSIKRNTRAYVVAPKENHTQTRQTGFIITDETMNHILEVPRTERIPTHNRSDGGVQVIIIECNEDLIIAKYSYPIFMSIQSEFMAKKLDEFNNAGHDQTDAGNRIIAGKRTKNDQRWCIQ
jgi:hypothetical protein